MRSEWNMGLPMKNRLHGCRAMAFVLACGTVVTGCLDSGDYTGGGRTILLPGWDATGGAASGTIIEIDAGAPPQSTTDASVD
jgi:hypothetical protein